MMKNSALVVVDMLYDFIDGSMACKNSENAVNEAVKAIDRLTGSQEGDSGEEILDTFPVLFVCDHHPADHSSFKEFGGIWPAHCVQGTHGGDIHESLKPYAAEELTFYKGCDPAVEQYSGFGSVKYSLCWTLPMSMSAESQPNTASAPPARTSSVPA